MASQDDDDEEDDDENEEASSTFFNDLYKLDLTSFKWSILQLRFDEKKLLELKVFNQNFYLNINWILFFSIFSRGKKEINKIKKSTKSKTTNENENENETIMSEEDEEEEEKSDDDNDEENNKNLESNMDIENLTIEDSATAKLETESDVFQVNHFFLEFLLQF